MRIILAFLVVVSSAVGCAGPAASPAPPPQVSETPPVTRDPGAVVDQPPTPTMPPPEQTGGTTTGKADGAACLGNQECLSGTCEGQGCTDDQPGVCMSRQRACTRDLRPYCGCDGKTFRTSGSCPGQRFSARAECPK